MADSQRKTANLLNSDQSTQGDGYVDNALLKDGNIIQNTNAFFVTEYIPVTEGTYYYYNNLFRTTVGYINYYNSNKIHLGNVQQKSVMTQGTYNLTALTIPSGVSYIRMSIDKQSTENGLYTSQLPAYEPYGWVHSLRKLTTATEAVENPLYSDGSPITVYTLKGNEEHTGTPTPSNPVMPNGVGERTENLSPVGSFTITAHDASQRVDIFSGILEAGNYVVALNQDNAISGSTRNTLQVTVGGTTYYNSSSANYHNQSGQQKMTFTVTETGNVDVKYWANDLNENCSYSNITFNAGSDVINEPYGYKIPISSGQQTTNIYLSEPLYKIGDYADVINADGTITRNIKRIKLSSLTWEDYDTNQFASPQQVDKIYGSGQQTMICDTYVSETNRSTLVNNSIAPWNSSTNNRIVVQDNRYTTAADWIAAMGDVTLWYIAATPTTETITAPSIPTTEGANSITVDTTVQPSEFTATWTGWHDSSVKEWDGSDWQ